MLRWPLQKTNSKTNQLVAGLQPRIRLVDGQLSGEIAWPYDPLYRPLVGIFVAKVLDRVVVTYRAHRAGTWVCSFAADLRDLMERSNEVEIVCLETGDVLYREPIAGTGAPGTAIGIAELIALADKKRQPWDCSGFLDFLELSIPDQVGLAYRDFLARGVDVDGLDSFTRRIDSGEMTILDLRDRMVSSDEFNLNVKGSVYGRLGHWIVWGGLRGIHGHLVQDPTPTDTSASHDRSIRLGIDSIVVGSLERISSKMPIGSYLARLALGPSSDPELRKSWEGDHSAFIVDLYRTIEERMETREQSARKIGTLRFSGLLESMRVGDAAKIEPSGIRSKPGSKGVVFFGPYLRLSPGDYRLDVRAHLSKGSGPECAWAWMEASYKDLMLGCLGLDESAFASANHILDFRVPEGLTGPWFEFRLHTNGVADIDVLDLSLTRLADGSAIAPVSAARSWLPVFSVGAAGEPTTKGIMGKIGVEGHLFYGPYRAQLPGKYVVAIDYEGVAGPNASLRLEVVNATEQSVLVSRDGQVDTGPATLEAFFAVGGEDVAVEGWPLLEFRLGKSASADLLITAVRVESV